MGKLFIGSILGAAVGAFAFWLISDQLASGQTGYTPPQHLEGVPDLSGIWQANNAAEFDILPHSPAWDVPGGTGIVEGDELPYTPAGLAKKDQNYATRADMDPTAVRCQMAGVPRIMYQAFPFQIVQSRDYTVMLFEYNHHMRILYTNDSKHPEGYQTYMGDSRAHWEGNTLVVDVTGFTHETWFDRAGNHHSDQLHITERITRVAPDILNYEATLEDPATFTRPWKVSFPLYRRQERNLKIMEYPCHALKEEEYAARGTPLAPGWHLRGEGAFTVGGNE